MAVISAREGVTYWDVQNMKSNWPEITLSHQLAKSVHVDWVLGRESPAEAEVHTIAAPL